MAVDKLVDSSQLDSNLTAVANAIRNKTGQTGQLTFPTGMVNAIASIVTGGGSSTPQLQAKTATPSLSQQVISPDYGKDGLSSVTVNAITASLLQSLDSDFVAANIKKGVDLFGRVGTYEGTGGSGGGSSGGGGSFSFEAKTETWQHNSYVTISVDIDEEGNIAARHSAGGGTANNLVICYPQGNTYADENVITKLPTPTEAGEHTIDVSIWWDNQNGAHQDHNEHTLTYTVVGSGEGDSGGSGVTVEPLSVTQNGTYTAPSGKAYSPVTVNVPTGGGADQIGTATATPASNAATVTFTGLKGTPKWFIFIPNSDVPAASGSRRVTSHIFNGTSDIGQSLISSGSSWSVTYSVTRNTTNFSHTYQNGSLTLNSGGASAGGTYHNVASTLIYGY